METQLASPDATRFLNALRTAYMKGGPLPEYLTFYISARIFSYYIDECKGAARQFDDTAPIGKFLLQRIRAKPDPILRGLEARVVTGRYDWEM